MNILFVLDNYWPFKGGAETLFRNLAEGLAKKGHKVVVLTRRIKGTKAYEELNGVRIQRISTLNRYLFPLLAIPKAAALARKADIIHTTTFASALPAYLAAKLRKKISAITVHEVWLGKWKEYTDMSAISAAIHNFLEKLIYKLKFDRYICVSESTRRQLLSACRWIKAGKTEVIHNGLDYRHFSPKKHNGRAVRRKLGIGKEFVCLTYGRAAPSKGMEYAAASVPLIRISDFRYIFIVAKDYSSSYSKFSAEIKKTGSSRTLLLEPISYEELPDYIAAADCVVVPSLSEGFGYTAAEAAAMGKTIVATNTTSLPEVVSGKCVLVEPRSAKAIAEGIEKVYNKKYSVTKMKRFTIEENVRRYLALYNKLTRKI